VLNQLFNFYTQVTVSFREREQKSPANLARNPIGTLLVFELDDGSYIIESLATIKFLEECYSAPPIIGRTGLDRAPVRELERIAKLGVLLPVARIIHATNSPFGFPPKSGVASHFRSVLSGALEVLEERLSDGRRFVAGLSSQHRRLHTRSRLQFARFGDIGI
jgi:glutathione S-transferase